MADKTPKTQKAPAAKATPKKTEKSADTGIKNLSNLSPNAGSHRQRKRKGRGIGSGLGKTGGRGHKGQRARKSGNVRPGFEGGQMKLYMRLPKRGFNNVFRTEFNVINLDQLSKLFPAGAKVDQKTLEEAGLIRFADRPVKLLGRGALSHKLDISVHKASTSAQAAVEKAGGTLKIIDKLV